MKNAPMRFGGLSLNHNPHKLVIGNNSNIRELMPPCCDADSVYLGERMKTVSGEGELYGADCLEQFAALDAMRKSYVCKKLSLPRLRPFYAFLQELEMTAQPVDGVLSYRFVFCQAQSPRKSVVSNEFYTVTDDGESLWDISYLFSVKPERLVELNPRIRYVDELSAGMRVRIC